MLIPPQDHACLSVHKSHHFLEKILFVSQIVVGVAMQTKIQEPVFMDAQIILLQIIAHILVLVNALLSLLCLLKVVQINAYFIALKITFYLLTTAPVLVLKIAQMELLQILSLLLVLLPVLLNILELSVPKNVKKFVPARCWLIILSDYALLAVQLIQYTMVIKSITFV